MTEETNSIYVEMLEEAKTEQKINFSPGPEYAADKRLFQGIPSIECARGGRLWAIWFAGGQGESPLSYVALVTSGDGGQTWSDLQIVIDPPGKVRAYDPCLWLDPNGKLWVCWTQAHTLHDGQWGVWVMTTTNPDNEKPDWSKPRRIADGIMLNKPTVLANSEWLFPVSFSISDSLDKEKKMMPYFLRTNLYKYLTDDDKRRIDERAGAHVYSSKDSGETFLPKGAARASEECRSHNEHMVIERNDKSLWMLMRTSYGIGQSFSHDGGKSWTEPEPSGIPHTSSRFFVRKLQSGKILLVKNCGFEETDANGEPIKMNRSQLMAYLSADEGHTWKGGLLLEKNGCSYPDGCQQSDGTLHIIYDHGRRSEKEIRMAKITEQDVLAGKLLTEKSRLATVVNKATGVITDEIDWSHQKGKDDPNEPLIFTGI